MFPSSRRPRRNPAGLVTITTIFYKANMTKAGKSAGRECSSIGLEHMAFNQRVDGSSPFSLTNKFYPLLDTYSDDTYSDTSLIRKERGVGRPLGTLPTLNIEGLLTL